MQHEEWSLPTHQHGVGSLAPDIDCTRGLGGKGTSVTFEIINEIAEQAETPH